MLAKTFSIFAAAALAAAGNTVTFVSQDATDRTLIFTPSTGNGPLPSARVSAGSSVTVDFPQAWIGNWFAVSDGKPTVPGMLGEVTFQGWNDHTYFDVSAIVTPSDHDGVYEMWPATALMPTSGCKLFPCNNAYYVWDDQQTKVTPETDLICTLGKKADPTEGGDADKVYPREYVTGEKR